MKWPFLLLTMIAIPSHAQTLGGGEVPMGSGTEKAAEQGGNICTSGQQGCVLDAGPGAQDASREQYAFDLAKVAIKRLGIDAELRRLGARSGTTVRIGPVELEWGDED